MSWFYTAKLAEEMDARLRGPYATQQAAESAKTTESTDEPNKVYGDVFEEAEDYRLPTQVMILAQEGVDWVVYADGSTRQKV